MSLTSFDDTNVFIYIYIFNRRTSLLDSEFDHVSQTGTETVRTTGKDKSLAHLQSDFQMNN